ncbi:MAG: hypothetical protein B6229_04840 [Spirochaetaceae bacterium 4572_7]|nr:MAG: hypothetical protein B6229_04840 [Spirochaetaceae bacterium 4572_7]
MKKIFPVEDNFSKIEDVKPIIDENLSIIDPDKEELRRMLEYIQKKKRGESIYRKKRGVRMYLNMTLMKLTFLEN